MVATSDLAAQFAKLSDEIDALEEQVKNKNKELAALNRSLTERYGLENIQSMAVEVDGKRKTVYLRRQYWAKKKDETVSSEDIYNALYEAGLSELAQRTYSHQSLSAYMREKRAENPDFDIPEPLSKLVEFKETAQVVVTGK